MNVSVTHGSRQFHRRRKGVITIEMLLVSPILVISVLGIFEMGNLVASSNQVVLSARNGALVAAALGTPGNVQAAVNDTLLQAGITTTGVTVSTSSSATAATVTVTVPLQNTCPDFLTTFGFSLSGKTFNATVTMPLNP
ncbi:MAG: TadE/TadG family type IV pilus assembly protein [Planctomycetota bacterium]